MITTDRKLNVSDAELARAREWADEYRVVLHQTADGRVTGRGLELPGVIVTRATADACLEACRRAMAVAVAVLLREGGRPPSPMVEQKLEEQINFRVTREDRLRIEGASHAAGFRGVSEFVRNAVLERLNHD